MNRHRPFLAAVAALLIASGPAAAVTEEDFEFDWDDGEIIVIELDDARTFDEAVLIAPDGREIAAYEIDRDRETSSGSSGTSWGMGTGIGVGTGGSSGVGVGVGIGFPVAGSSDGTTTRYETEARIRVPDMAAYRAGWQGWVLRVHLPAEGPATERTIDFPAPEPPE